MDELTSPIHVLVNNVGTAYPTPEYFTDYPQDWQLNLINTNITSMTMMSDIVLRKMLKQEKRSWVNNRGIIINISSMAGTTELPLFSTYAACIKVNFWLYRLKLIIINSFPSKIIYK